MRGAPARHAHLQALSIMAGHRACAAVELLPTHAAEVKDGVLLADHGAELHADHLTNSGGVGEVHLLPPVRRRIDEEGTTWSWVDSIDPSGGRSTALFPREFLEWSVPEGL